MYQTRRLFGFDILFYDSDVELQEKVEKILSASFERKFLLALFNKLRI